MQFETTNTFFDSPLIPEPAVLLDWNAVFLDTQIPTLQAVDYSNYLPPIDGNFWPFEGQRIQSLDARTSIQQLIDRGVLTREGDQSIWTRQPASAQDISTWICSPIEFLADIIVPAAIVYDERALPKEPDLIVRTDGSISVANNPESNLEGGIIVLVESGAPTLESSIIEQMNSLEKLIGYLKQRFSISRQTEILIPQLPMVDILSLEPLTESAPHFFGRLYENAQTSAADMRTNNANSFFFTQFRNERWNPTGPARSSNCGPASLAMAFKAFGKGPAQDNVENLISDSRFMMTGNRDISAYTGYDQIAQGARKGGLNAEVIRGIDKVNAAIDAGAMVVIGGNPARAWGGRLRDGSYSYYNGGHFALLVGRQGDNYVVNDPLSRNGSIVVSPQELNAFLSDPNMGYSKGVALWA